jgi:hypothetical protein
VTLASIAGITPHPLVQVGWSIFENVEYAVDKWVKATGAGPFFTLAHVPLLNVRYRGNPTEFDHTTAVGQWGGVQLELMLQHCNNPSHITEMCPDRKTRLTSVSWMVPDMKAEITRMEAQGFPIVWSCNVFDETMTAVWFDTLSLLGCFAEVFVDDPRMRYSFERCAHSALNWDGSRPLRPMQEMT